MDFLNESAPAADSTPVELKQTVPSAEAQGPGQPPAEPPGRMRLQQLHSFLVAEHTDVPEDYATFEQKLLEKPERLQQLHTYLVKEKTDVPAQYGVFEEKMTEGLPGYAAKKKVPSAPGGSAAGAGSPTGELDAPAVAVALPPGDQEFTALATEPASAGLQTVAPYQRGTGANPAARNLPDLATGAPATQAVGEQPAPDEQQYLDHLPAHPDPGVRADGRAYEPTPYGQELVQIPNDYTGRVPEGTFSLYLGGHSDRTQYFYRPLSDQVDGQQQSVYQAAAGRFKNSLFEMAQGAGEGTQALTNLPAALYEKATGKPGYHADFGAEFSGYLEGKKTKLADLYTKNLNRHTNANNLLLQSAEYAPLVVAQVAQTLAPELRAPAALQRALGLVSTVGFDAQLVHGAREQAKAAGLTGNSADLYTTLVGGLTLAGFKEGSKLMGALGDKLAVKLAPDALREQVALGAVQRVEQLQVQAGRAATAAETKQALHESLRAALPRLAQVPKEALQQAPVFGTVEGARLGADQVLAPALGGRAEELTPGQALARVGDAAKGGLLLGGITGGVDAALGGLTRRGPAPGQPLPDNVVALGATPGGRPLFAELGPDNQPARYFDERGAVDFGPAGPPPAVHQAVGAALARRNQPPTGAPAPATEPTPASAPASPPADSEAGQLYEVRRPTGQVELTRAQLVRLDGPQGKAVVRAVDAQGNPVEREVALTSLMAMSAPAPRPATATPATEPSITTSNQAAAADEASPASTPPEGTASADAPVATSPASPAPAYGTPAQNRAAGRFEKDGQVVERPAPLGERAARGAQATAEFASGVQQPVHYAVVEATDVQPSHLGGTQNLRHFLPEAQPKNRSAAYDPASQKAIADIAAAPDLGRLAEAPNAYSGAPVINERGEVVQGNGRAAGIRQHYAQGGESYKRDVVAAAERAGIPASETAKFRQPVLVRVADVSDQRSRELGNYSAADTESGGRRRLDVRQASGRLDEAARADLARLATPQGEATLTETLRANGTELLRLLRRAGAVNETQLQTMTKADGTLTPQGVEDLAGLYRHQLFAEGDPNLPELFAELPAAAQGGLDRAVGSLLGVPEAASLVPEVQQAIHGVRELQASGADFATWAGQADAFRGGQAPRERYSPLTLRLVELLVTERRPTVIARYFQEYARAVRGEADSLFGATPPQSRAEASQQVFGAADTRAVVSPSQPIISPDERPRPTDPRDARAAEDPPRPGAADQRPATPEPPSAPGPATAAGDPAGARTDAGDSQPRPASGVASAAQPAPERSAEVAASAAPTANPIAALRTLNGEVQRAQQEGDQATADQLADQAQQAAKEAAGGREDEPGRGALTTRLLAEHAPAVVVHLAEQAAARERAAAEQHLAKQAEAEGQQLRQGKSQALAHALATPAVRAVRDAVAGKTPPTTAEQLATVRAERARLLDELRQGSKPSDQVYSTVVPITPQMARSAELHVKIFRTYVQEGIVHVRDLVARWKRDAGPLVAGISDDELTKLATTALSDHRIAVRQGVAELGTTLDKIARDYTTSAEQVGATLAQRFVDAAGLAPADAQRLADAIRQEFDRRIATARQRRLDALQKRTTGPTSQQSAADQVARVRELFTLSPTSDAAILDHLRHTTDLPGLSEGDAARLRQLADAVNAAPTGFQKDEAVGKLLDATARLRGVDWLEVSSALWYANVLSGWKTHALNLFANTLQTGSEALVHTTQAVLSGRGRFATASARGLAEGLQRGAREAASVLSTGRQVSRDGQKFEVPDLLEQIRFAGGAINPLNHLKLVGRALRAGDVLFSTGLKEMRAHELAVKQALTEGQSGEPSDATWARVNELLYRTRERLAAARAQAAAEGLRGNDLARRVYELAEQSRPVGITEEAREYGTRAVFNGEVKGGLGWVTTGIQHITQGIDIAGFKPAKLVIPFTRVIANVANASLDYTPVGAARAGVSLAREQLGRGSGGHLLGGKADSKLQRQLTGEERAHLAIKSVLGSSVAVAAYALSHNQDEQGRPTLDITGAGTGDPAKDAQLRADGWQPYSVKAGGKWYSYANTPVGTMLAVIGNLNDGERYRQEHIQDSDDALHALWLNAFRALQFTKDQTALKGAADFLTAADSKSPEQLTRWAQRLAVGTVRGYVPWSAMLTQLAKDGERLAGQPKKQARTFGQALVQDIPVARDGLQNALDVLGDPLPIDTDRILSERPTRDAPTRAVWDWLEKNHLFIPTPSRNSGGAMVLRAHHGEETPMTDAEYYRFVQKRGQLLKASLQQQLPELQSLTPAEAKKVLKQQVQRATRAAKQQVFTGQ